MSDAERAAERIARKEAKRKARKEAKAAAKAEKMGFSAKEREEFEAERKRRGIDAATWRKEKAERNRAAGGCNGSRKPGRSIDNRKNGNATGKEEMEERLDAAVEFIKVNKKYLGAVLDDFALVGDPRHQSYIKYSVPELLMFGLLSFMFQAGSRRASNAGTSPVLLENIQEFFTQIEKLPHADTLCNFLKVIDADDIEEVKLSLIARLNRNKVLDPFKINGAVPFALDGVHKFTRDYEWCQNASAQRVSGKPEEEKRYHAYALELSIMLPGGRTLPVMTEFIDRAEYGDCGTGTEKAKQDCETNAAKRLIARLRNRFPCLDIIIAADGLYATGPMLQMCLEKRIEPMFTLQDKSLPSVWEEANAHIESGMHGERPLRVCNDVGQRFLYVNDIEYEFGDEKRRVNVHVAICEEERREFDQKAGCAKTTSSTFAWLSLRRFSNRDVEPRCNQIGRPRWNIETQNRIEKHDGYAYSHCFSLDWEAMRAYHFLMQIAYILNMLIYLSSKFAPLVKARGFAQAIKYMWLTFNGAILDYDAIRERIPDRYQIRWAI